MSTKRTEHRDHGAAFKNSTQRRRNERWYARRLRLIETWSVLLKLSIQMGILLVRTSIKPRHLIYLARFSNPDLIIVILLQKCLINNNAFHDELNTVTFSPDVVERKLQELKPFSTPGPDYSSDHIKIVCIDLKNSVVAHLQWIDENWSFTNL